MHTIKLNSFMMGILSCVIVQAQGISIDSSKYPKPVNLTAQQDQQNMMQQLGIKQLRPGPSGNENAPNHANYDESKANPCPELPDVLTTNAGKKVTSADMWWKDRRPELVAAIEKELYGKLPSKIPNVSWTVKVTDREFIGRTPAIVKQLVGHVDNNEYPLLNVDINAMLVVPTNVKGPVPVLMMFGFPSFPAPAQPSPADLAKINEAFKDLMINLIVIQLIHLSHVWLAQIHLHLHLQVIHLLLSNYSLPDGDT
jgi:hypothetical protein